MLMIGAYSGVSNEEICATRLTSEGKAYSLNHSEELIVDMRYKGEGRSNTNSQGWERSSTYFFSELQSRHPEYFSKKNTIRIANKESPIVDKRLVDHFPEYKGYENETLIHHHIGKDGQAVAVPQSIHKGSGEIHVFENGLGITDNAKSFSQRCKELCERDPSYVGRTSNEFKNYFENSNSESEDITLTGKGVLNNMDKSLTLHRNMTPEMLDSRRLDTETVLDNYRENLRDQGVTDEAAIERFISQEREKISSEYESLDRGDIPETMYQEPDNWKATAERLKAEPSGETREDNTASQDITGSASRTEYISESRSNAFSEASKSLNGQGPETAKSNAFTNATKISGENFPQTIEKTGEHGKDAERSL